MNRHYYRKNGNEHAVVLRAAAFFVEKLYKQKRKTQKSDGICEIFMEICENL